MVPYLGFGPSAHSCDGKNRFWNYQDISRYISLLKGDQLPLESRETLTQEQRIIEMVMLGLRTARGIDIALFESLAGRDFRSCFGEVIGKVASRSWGGFKYGGDNYEHFCLNIGGWGFLDTVTGWFVDSV